MNEEPTLPISRLGFMDIAGIKPMELASLAAAMANTAEAPSVTAQRAMELFQACRDEVWRIAGQMREVQNDEIKRRERYERDRDFFASLGSGEFEMIPCMKANTKIGLEIFLQACMPNSKKETRLQKWREFLKRKIVIHHLREIRKGFCGKSNDELATAVAEEMRIYREEGISARVIPSAREIFADFLEMHTDAIKLEKAEKAKRARLYCPIARKISSGEKLTEGDNDILKSLTPEEQEAAEKSQSLKMTPKEIRLWKAAVVDAGIPPSAKPKIKKSAKIEKN